MSQTLTNKKLYSPNSASYYIGYLAYHMDHEKCCMIGDEFGGSLLIKCFEKGNFRYCYYLGNDGNIYRNMICVNIYLE